MDSEDLSNLYSHVFYLILMTIEHRNSLDENTFNYIFENLKREFIKYNNIIQNNEVLLLAAKQEEEREKRAKQLHKEFKGDQNIPVYIKNFEVYNDTNFNLELNRKVNELKGTIELYKRYHYQRYFDICCENRFKIKNEYNSINNNIKKFDNNLLHGIIENRFFINKTSVKFAIVNEINFNYIVRDNNCLSKKYVFLYKIREEHKRNQIIDELRKVLYELEDYVMTKEIINGQFKAYYLYVKFKTHRFEGLKKYNKYIIDNKKINNKHKKDYVLNIGEIILIKD